MKVSELIEALKLMPQDLEVYGYCDHGQTPEKVSNPTTIYCLDIDYTLYGEYSTDKDEAKEYGYKSKAVLL